MADLLNKIFTQTTNNPSSDYSEIIGTNELDELNRKYFKNELGSDFDFLNFNLGEDFSKSETEKKSENVLENKIPKKYSDKSWYSFFRIPFLSNDNTVNHNNSRKTFNLIQTLKGYASDPLGIATMILSGILLFFYFAGELMFQAFGLFYPTYYLYTIMNYKIQNKLEKLALLLKYFIIYAHLEFVSSIFKILGLYFSHLKIMVIVLIIYLLKYQPQLLGEIYDKILFYDKIIIRLVESGINSLWSEYLLIRKKMEKIEKQKN